jgi:hypothetical protein
MKIDKARSRTRWGHWIFQRESNELVYREWQLYAVDLDRMTSSAAVLDVIMQVTAKTWCTAQDAKDLIEAIRSTVDPQATLCSFGVERGQR